MQSALCLGGVGWGWWWAGGGAEVKNIIKNRGYLWVCVQNVREHFTLLNYSVPVIV